MPVDINNARNYKQCRRKLYEAWVCAPELGSVVINMLEYPDAAHKVGGRTLFTLSSLGHMSGEAKKIISDLVNAGIAKRTSKESRFVFCGVRGEYIVMSASYLMQNFEFLSSGHTEPITPQSLQSKLRGDLLNWTRLQSKTDVYPEVACFVPLDEIFVMPGQRPVTVNAHGIPHGYGDFIVAPSINGVPDMSMRRVVNGEVFAVTYNNRDWQGYVDSFLGNKALNRNALPNILPKNAPLSEEGKKASAFKTLCTDLGLNTLYKKVMVDSKFAKNKRMLEVFVRALSLLAKNKNSVAIDLKNIDSYYETGAENWNLGLCTAYVPKAGVNLFSFKLVIPKNEGLEAQLIMLNEGKSRGAYMERIGFSNDPRLVAEEMRVALLKLLSNYGLVEGRSYIGDELYADCIEYGLVYPFDTLCGLTDPAEQTFHRQFLAFILKARKTYPNWIVYAEFSGIVNGAVRYRIEYSAYAKRGAPDAVDIWGTFKNNAVVVERVDEPKWSGVVDLDVNSALPCDALRTLLMNNDTPTQEPYYKLVRTELKTRCKNIDIGSYLKKCKSEEDKDVGAMMGLALAELYHMQPDIFTTSPKFTYNQETGTPDVEIYYKSAFAANDCAKLRVKTGRITSVYVRRGGAVKSWEDSFTLSADYRKNASSLARILSERGLCRK